MEEFAANIHMGKVLGFKSTFKQYNETSSSQLLKIIRLFLIPIIKL